YMCRDDTEKARGVFTAGLALREEFPVSKPKRLALQNFMGRSRIVEGKLDQALEIFQETDRIWREELKPREKKEVLNNDLATVYHLKQDEAKALEQFQKDLEFYQSIHHHFLTARTHYHLGEVHQALKEIPKAIEHYKTCVELSKAHRHYEMLFRAYNGLGNLYHAEKDSENALHYYGRALTIAQKIQDVNSQAAISVNMAILHNEAGEFEKAHPYLVNAVFLLERIPQRTSFQNYFLARAKMESGDVNRKLKKFEAARDELRDALKMVEANVQMKSQLYWVHATLARLYFDQGRSDEAKESLEAARKTAQDASHQEDLKELEERAKGAPTQPKAEPKRAVPAAAEVREESG